MAIATQSFVDLLECTSPGKLVSVPNQGQWTVAEYLALDTNRLVEFTDGQLEVLPMPSVHHQEILLYLYRLLYAFVSEHRLGKVLTAPLPTFVAATRYREPDIVVVLAQNRWRAVGDFLQGADLVIEVVSPDDSRRDYVRKRADYAAAAIPEYWIVDPQRELITVLVLDGEQYAEHGAFLVGDQATSVLLAGFTVAVSEVFAQAA